MRSARGQRKRAVVIGGSIGGLFAGLFLRKIGWEVSIHERADEELGSRGAGIATHDDLHEALALATGQGGEVGGTVEGRIVLARSGDVVCEVARPQVLASWDRIWQRLRVRAGDVYRDGISLTSVEQDEQRVVARFDDGSEVAADLLVAADGIQSTVRRQLRPGVEPRYASYVAWRGLGDMAELSGKARDLLRNRFAFCLPDREQALGYPVDGGPGSGGRYNCVWYRPADPAQDLPHLLTGADGRQYSGAVPPDRLHPDVLARMRADATSLLAPPFAEVMTKTRQPLLQAIVDLETPAMIVGRVALVGDAAFVARPHVGMGTTKAAGDARALADHLARSTTISMPHWQPTEPSGLPMVSCRPPRQTSRSLYAGTNRFRGGAAASATFPQTRGGDDRNRLDARSGELVNPTWRAVSTVVRGRSVSWLPDRDKPRYSSNFNTLAP
jgi:2-polyprenyl-6-methoxyphenol hydroxylase-like FAD-dependent oxidoreductase